MIGCLRLPSLGARPDQRGGSRRGGAFGARRRHAAGRHAHRQPRERAAAVALHVCVGGKVEERARDGCDGARFIRVIAAACASAEHPAACTLASAGQARIAATSAARTLAVSAAGIRSSVEDQPASSAARVAAAVQHSAGGACGAVCAHMTVTSAAMTPARATPAWQRSRMPSSAAHALIRSACADGAHQRGVRARRWRCRTR
jgi:hypothetical protein